MGENGDASHGVEVVREPAQTCETSSSVSISTQSLFKKRQKKRKKRALSDLVESDLEKDKSNNGLIRKTVDDHDESDAHLSSDDTLSVSDPTALQKLEDLRLLHYERKRLRRSGVGLRSNLLISGEDPSFGRSSLSALNRGSDDHHSVSTVPDLSTEGTTTTAASSSDGNLSRVGSASAALELMGQSTFSEQSDTDLLQSRREQWLRSELKKRLGQKHTRSPNKTGVDKCDNQISMVKEIDHNTNDDDDNDARPEQGVRMDESVSSSRGKYEMPTHLSIDTTRIGSYEAGERWLGGMAEVELPVSVTLRNIEETEQAKRALLQPQASRSSLVSSNGSVGTLATTTKESGRSAMTIPRNFNMDFTARHFDRVAAMAQRRRQQHGNYYSGNHGGRHRRHY